MTVRLDNATEASGDIPIFEDISAKLETLLGARRCRVCGSADYIVSMRSRDNSTTPAIPHLEINDEGLNSFPQLVSVVVLVTCARCGIIDTFDATTLARYLAGAS